MSIIVHIRLNEQKVTNLKITVVYIIINIISQILSEGLLDARYCFAMH